MLCDAMIYILQRQIKASDQDICTVLQRIERWTALRLPPPMRCEIDMCTFVSAGMA